MKEIEVKARLKDKEKVLSELKKSGCVLGDPVRQIDTVYTRVIGGLQEYLTNDHFVRIREKSDGRFIFTVKVPKALKENLVKQEHETEIKNALELEQSLFIMGYKISNKVIKIRYTAKLNDYEICIDEVEDLGSFIEVEKLAEHDSDEAVILKELQAFLFSLGISESDEVKKGYDILMIEKTQK